MKKDKHPNEALRYHRLLRGWSQTKVADEIGASNEMICNWERGMKRTSSFYQEKLCTLFGMNAAELGFLGPTSDNPSPVAPAQEPLSNLDLPLSNNGETIQRFDAPFVLSSHQQEETYAQFSYAIKQGIIEAVRELEGGTNLDLSRRRLIRQTFPFLFGVSNIIFDASVNEVTVSLAHPLFEKQLVALWDMYHTGGTLQADYQLKLLFDRVDQKQASEVLCMSYQLQGSLYRDKMKFDDAHILYQKAFEVAKELNDVELMGAALARKGVTYIQQNVAIAALEHLSEALRLIKERSFPCLSGYILQALSEAHALAQQPYKSEHNIEMAQQTLMARGRYQERTYCQANTTSVTAQRGVNAVHLHDYATAITLIDQGIENYSPTLVRGRARLKAQQSEAYYGLRDIHACCQSATEAWILARAANSNRIFARLRKLQIDLVTSSWKKKASVLDLNWVMTTL